MKNSSLLSRRVMLKRGAATAAFLALPVACSDDSEPDTSNQNSASDDQQKRVPDFTAVAALTFPGTYNLLIWAARDRDFFAEEGLSVSREATTTSMHLIRSVNSESYPIGSSSIDNVVAYNEGQGQVELERDPRLFSFMSVQPNLVLPLAVTPEIETIDDLRGRTLAVDAVSTGFSFVLREILREHGLGMDDYELVSVGNARDRLEALKASKHAGAVLTPPFDRTAEDAGLKIIASSKDVFENYQGTTFITSRYWAAGHEEQLIGYIKAILRSLNWINDPLNTDAAAALLQAEMGLPDRAAKDAVNGLRDTLSPDFNMAGVQTVLDIRSRYGKPQKKLNNPNAYIDTQYLETARAALAS